MTIRSPLVALGVGGWLWFLAPAGQAQETPSEAPPAAAVTTRIPLATTLLQLHKLDDDLMKKVDALCTLIDTEAMAKRLPEPVAQSLRWNLHNFSAAAQPNIRIALGVTRLPLEDAQIMDGIEKLEADWTANERERTTQIVAGVREAQLRLEEVTKTAGPASDIDSLIAVTDQLQTEAQKHSPAVAGPVQASSLCTYVGYLQALRRVIALGPQSDEYTVSAVLFDFQNVGNNSARDAVDRGAVRRRIEQALTPFQKAEEDAQQALDEALQQNKSAAVLLAALVRFEDASTKNRQAREGLYLGANPPTPADVAAIHDAYRNLVETAGAMESGDFHRAHAAIDHLQGTGLKPLGAARAVTFDALLAEWRKTIDEHGGGASEVPSPDLSKAREALTRQREALSRQLAGIKTPIDLEAFAAGLSANSGEARGEPEDGALRNLSAQLTGLATAWMSANPDFLRQVSFEPSASPFSVPLDDLRTRILRDVLARSIGAPELNAPPLADLQPEKRSTG